MPGHDALVTTLAFDGKTTGEQAAVQVLNAERTKRAAIGTNLVADAPKPAPNAAVPEPEVEKPEATIDPMANAKKAQTYIDEQAKLGHKVSPAEAVAHVTKEAK